MDDHAGWICYSSRRASWGASKASWSTCTTNTTAPCGTRSTSNSWRSTATSSWWVIHWGTSAWLTERPTWRISSRSASSTTRYSHDTRPWNLQHTENVLKHWVGWVYKRREGGGRRWCMNCTQNNRIAVFEVIWGCRDTWWNISVELICTLHSFILISGVRKYR